MEIMAGKIFRIIICAVVFVWVIIQTAFYASFYINKFLSTSDEALCQKEQNFALLQILDIIKNEPHCHKMIELVQKSIHENKPTIYFVTPTYKRPMQKADLTRLLQTLKLVPNIHWIIIEDSENKTSMVTDFLAKIGIPSTHLNIATPQSEKLKKLFKGVLQRNIAISWLLNHTNPRSDGVVYFADDDNTYDVEIFEEMRYTKKVSVWPVGLVGGLMVERPLVKNNKVVGWNAAYKPFRPFPIDMAGFAVNLILLHQHPEAGFSFSVPTGYLESSLLEYLVTVDELEPKANSCTKVLVWHTRTAFPNLKEENNLLEPSNLDIEV